VTWVTVHPGNVHLRRALAAVLLSLAVGSVAGGCGTFAQSSAPAGVDQLRIPTPSPRPEDFVTRVDNPWLPLRDGATATFDVVRPGAPQSARVVQVLPGRVRIAGVAATAVRSTSGAEATTDYYAQDRSGNVWWFGHDGGARSWRAGQGGAEAGLAMAATPRRGDGYRTAYAPGVVEDVATVVRVGPDQVQVDVASALDAGRVTRESYQRGVGLSLRVDATTGAYEELRR
jgi:hypothetical protein